MVRRRIQIGLIGTAIQRSKSPMMHMAEGASQGLDLSYDLIDLAERGVGAAALPDSAERSARLRDLPG